MDHPLRSPRVANIERASQAVWRVLSSPYTDLALLAALGIMVLLGGLVPQVPSGVSAQSAQYHEWLAPLRSRWGGLTDALATAGILDIFHGRLFRIILAMVAAVAGLRLLEHWAPFWVTPSNHPRETVGLPLSCDVEGAWKRTPHALSLAGLSIIHHIKTGDSRWIWAQRLGAARWAPGLFYIGVLALVLASLVQGRYGWVSAPLDLAVGEARTLDRARNLTVRLDEVALVPGVNDSLRRLDTVLTLTHGAEAGQEVRLGMGQPARARGLTFYQLAYGPAARVSAQDASGQDLSVQGMVGDAGPRRSQRVRFSERQQEWLLAVPQADLIVRLVHYPTLPAQGIPRRALHVQVYQARDGQVLAEQFLPETGKIPMSNAVIDVAFEYYVTLRAEDEPGLPLAAAGGALALLGLLGWVIWPPRDLAIGLLPTNRGTRCQLVLPLHASGAAWVQIVRSALIEEQTMGPISSLKPEGALETYPARGARGDAEKSNE